MADRVPSKLPPIETKIPVVDEVLPNEKVWEYQRRVRQAQINKGSRYPPFSIQPMPYQRQRLDKPMTEADRFLRRQWLHDQNLSPLEPRNVPEAVPMCKMRLLNRFTWDMFEIASSYLVGKKGAAVTRLLVPKFLLAYGVFVGIFYQITYNPKTWETHHHAIVTGERRARFADEDNSHLPADPVFCSRGFDQRTSHLNPVTSAAGQ